MNSFCYSAARGSQSYSYRHSLAQERKMRNFGSQSRQILNWIYMRYYDNTMKKKKMKKKHQIDRNTISVNNSNSNTNWCEQHKYLAREWKFNSDKEGKVQKTTREENEKEKKFYVQSNHGITLILFWRTAETCLFRWNFTFSGFHFHWMKQNSNKLNHLRYRQGRKWKKAKHDHGQIRLNKNSRSYVNICCDNNDSFDLFEWIHFLSFSDICELANLI